MRDSYIEDNKERRLQGAPARCLQVVQRLALQLSP